MDTVERKVLAAMRQAVRRIEQLNVGTDDLGEDPTLAKLRSAIVEAEAAWRQKERQS